MSSLAVLAAFCHLFFHSSLAVPVARAAAAASSHTATFENTTGSAITTPVLPGVYEALQWSTFVIGPYQYQAGFCAGVCPETFPAEASFGYSSTDTTGPASVSSLYDGSTVNSFSLTDFYFGCQALQVMMYEGESETIKTPATCAMIVKGYATTAQTLPGPDEPPDAITTFTYEPVLGSNQYTGAPSAPMMHVVMPDTFKDMKAVTFNSTVDRAKYISDPTTFLDTVAYTVN